MVTGPHTMLFSPEADREFLRDVLQLAHARAGGPDVPWLVFRLPPAEVGGQPGGAEAGLPQPRHTTARGG